MNTNTQVFRNFFTTRGTNLRCPFGWHFYNSSPSFFRFGLKNIKEVKPCHIFHTFIKTFPISIPTLKFFNTDYIIITQQIICNFIMKISTLIINLFVNFSNKYSGFLSTMRSFKFSAKRLLSGFQGIFGFLHKTWVRYFFTIRSSQKTLTAYIYPNTFTCFWQWLRWNIITRKINIPFSCQCFLNGYGLDVSFNRSMKFNFELSNLLNMKIFSIKLPACLFQSKTIISAISFKTRIARLFTRFNSSEKRLKRSINSFNYILKCLRRDFIKFRACFFQVWKLVVLFGHNKI